MCQLVNAKRVIIFESNVELTPVLAKKELRIA